MLTIIVCSVIAIIAYRTQIDAVPAAMLTFAIMLALNPAFIGAAPSALLASGILIYIGVLLMPVATNGIQPFAIMAVVGRRRIGLRFETVAA